MKCFEGCATTGCVCFGKNDFYIANAQTKILVMLNLNLHIIILVIIVVIRS